MAQHKQINREGQEELEKDSHQKKRTHQPLYDQLKATDEGVVHGIDFQVEPSADRHAVLLANAHSDKQRAHLVIQLQQSYGNAYVQRLLSSKAMQAKLTVNPPDDQYEREADRVADVVAQTSVSEVQRQPEEEEEEEPLQAKAISQIQRQLEEEEEEEIQTKAVGSQSLTVSEHLEAQIDEARGSGQPLDEQIRASLESQLGHDFSQVRIHTDAKADTLSRQLDAEAFTTGHHVFFKEGAYQPDSERGKGLIAHELTHVVQQEAAPALQRQAAEAPAAEAEADKGRLAALKAMFEAAVARPIGEAHKALGEEKPDTKGAYNNLVSAIAVVDSLIPSYKGVEPARTRLAGFSNVLRMFAIALEPHIGYTHPITEIRQELDPTGKVMTIWLDKIRGLL